MQCLQARHNHSWIATKQAFKRIHSRVKYRVMFLEKANEFTHLRFVGHKFACVLGNFDKTIAVARFFYFRKQKIQCDKIKMLNFISTTFNELTRRHKGWHMTAREARARERDRQ